MNGASFDGGYIDAKIAGVTGGINFRTDLR